jgi:hypothetical protein
LAAAPVPSLTACWASPPSALLAGLGLGDGRLDAGRPERDPGPVIHRPRLGDQAGDLDRVTLADARGHAGDLDGQDLGLALGQGDQLHHIERLAVLVRPWQTAYGQIADAIRADILAGVYEPSPDDPTRDQLPGAAELGSQYGVSDKTAARKEANAWLADLHQLGSQGRYFFSLNRYLFLATR